MESDTKCKLQNNGITAKDDHRGNSTVNSIYFEIEKENSEKVYERLSPLLSFHKENNYHRLRNIFSICQSVLLKYENQTNQQSIHIVVDVVLQTSSTFSISRGLIDFPITQN